MRPPDALDGARILALALLAIVAVGFLAGLGAPGWLPDGLLELSFLLIPLLYARLVGFPPLAANGYGRIGIRPLALVVAASVGSLWILKILLDLQGVAIEVLGLEKVTQAETEQIRESIEGVQKRGWLGTIVALVILPALCEETLFRGLLFRGFLNSLGRVQALVYTAVLFSILHMKVAQLLLMLFLGLYFGTVVWLTGSLWAGIIAHALNNLSVVVLTTQFSQHRLATLPSPWWLVLPSVAVFVIALLLLAADRPRTVPGPG